MNTRTLFITLTSLVAGLASFQSHAASVTDNPDLYGNVLFDPPHATTDATREPGKGDNYGSVLLDPASKATTDAMAERGRGDNYGSILLDIRLIRTGHARTTTI